MEKRVVVTGLGVVSPVGIGWDENWNSLMQGATGIAPMSRLATENLPVSLCAEIKDFDPKQFIKDRKAIRLTYFNVHLALTAATLAVEDSHIDPAGEDPSRFGAVVGSGGGGFDDGPGFEEMGEPLLRSWDEEKQRFDSARFGENGISAAYPLFLLKALPNNAFYYISLLFNIQGENDNIVSPYTGGAQAIGDAFRAIRRGLADIMIAGGYDSLLTPNTLFSLDSFGLLSKNTDPKTACRPFDRLRDGMVAGEGAGFLILEERSRAVKRGAAIYAEIVGYGNASSASHMFTPDPSGSGIVHALLRSLQDANIPPEDIGWVCADGTGTRDGDRAEAQALHAAMKNHAACVPVSATKCLTGHMGTGAGAAESIYTVLAVRNGILPPSCNYDNPDDGCRLHMVGKTPEEKNVAFALSLSQGIGGQSTALIFKHHSG